MQFAEELVVIVDVNESYTFFTSPEDVRGSFACDRGRRIE